MTSEHHDIIIMCSPVEYQAHISWSADIIHYINELPKLSVEMEQLSQHKEELEVSDTITDYTV